MSDPRPLTLLAVHAHPDDEAIGTGGTMAKAVAAGHRVVLVTCTRGELGEIVVPDLATPENHRRLGELRAAELEAALAELGVTEWDNLGYRDSDMMGRPGNLDPRSFWRADLDEAIGRLLPGSQQRDAVALAEIYKSSFLRLRSDPSTPQDTLYPAARETISALAAVRTVPIES